MAQAVAALDRAKLFGSSGMISTASNVHCISLLSSDGPYRIRPFRTRHGRTNENSEMTVDLTVAHISG